MHHHVTAIVPAPLIAVQGHSYKLRRDPLSNLPQPHIYTVIHIHQPTSQCLLRVQDALGSQESAAGVMQGGVFMMIWLVRAGLKGVGSDGGVCCYIWG